MPRNYVRKAGSRDYLTGYSQDSMNRALVAVTGGMKICKASKRYNVPLSTLRRKHLNLNTKSHGGQKCLSTEAEEALVKAVNTFTDWKVPLDGFDISCLVKAYLDRRGISDRCFKDNMPGRDWLKLFMKRAQPHEADCR